MEVHWEPKLHVRGMIQKVLLGAEESLIIRLIILLTKNGNSTSAAVGLLRLAASIQDQEDDIYKYEKYHPINKTKFKPTITNFHGNGFHLWMT